jgi:hypothetical protein
VFVDVKVNGQVVRAMVDIGVTHKFLSDFIMSLKCSQDPKYSGAILTKKKKFIICYRVKLSFISKV